jgi:ribosomal protein S6E (S10)
VKRKVVTPPARGKEGLLSDGAWKSVKALMMKISSGTDRSGDVLHRSGVRFSSLKAKKEVLASYAICKRRSRTSHRRRQLLTSEICISMEMTGVLHLHINSCTASQELKLLENQLTAIKRAEERKTCKGQESDRSGHRFGAGLGGSDAFVSRSSPEKYAERVIWCFSVLFIPEYGRRVAFYAFRSSTWPSGGRWILGHMEGLWPTRAWCWATLRGLHPQDSRRTPVHDEVLIW